VQVDGLSGGFHTPTDFGAGVYMASSGFTNDWGHIGIAQEVVNAYTASISTGWWPRDWWADHKSPFPTYVNWNVLQDLGLADDSYTFEYDLQHGPGPTVKGVVNGCLSHECDPYGWLNPSNPSLGLLSPSGQWDPQLMIYNRLKNAAGWG